MKAIALLLGGGILLLAGCSGGEHEDLRKWMSEVSKDAKGRIPPLPQVSPYSPVLYQPDGGLDPFKANKLVPEHGKSGGGTRPDLNRQKEELERFPLESLSFVGVMASGKQNHAIIKAESALHKVKVGNYLGQDFGIITKISEEALSLRELIQDTGGDWIERTSVLQLQEQKESKK